MAAENDPDIEDDLSRGMLLFLVPARAPCSPLVSPETPP